MFRFQTAVHSSNPDVRSGMYCREPAKKISDLFGFEASPERGGGALGEREFGLRNSEISLSPDNTPLGEWRNKNLKPRLRKAKSHALGVCMHSSLATAS